MTQTSDADLNYICAMPDAVPEQIFADLIRKARENRNWSQGDLEAESGVSRSTISRWERGLSDKPEPKHVRAVCRALGIDPRKAAVALGYLTPEEIAPATSRGLDPEVEEILAILPGVPPEERKPLIDYLKFLKARHDQAQRAG